MQRIAQCAMLGAAILLTAMHHDRREEVPVPTPESRPVSAAAVPAATPERGRLTLGEIRSFLVRDAIPHGHLDLRSLGERINVAAARHRLDPAMLLAVIRVESTFRPAAISHKGALGLMQILPGTGAELAAEMGLPWDGEHRLLEPDLNIELGAYYLRKLLDRFDGDREAALEAYFQGPNRLAARRRAEPGVPLRYARRVIPYWDGLR